MLLFDCSIGNFIHFFLVKTKQHQGQKTNKCMDGSCKPAHEKAELQ